MHSPLLTHSYTTHYHAASYMPAASPLSHGVLARPASSLLGSISTLPAPMYHHRQARGACIVPSTPSWKLLRLQSKIS